MKSKKIRIALYVLSILVLTFATIYNSGLIAKYISKTSATDSARVAKFDVKVNKIDDSALESETLNIDGLGDNPSQVYSFKVTNNSEVTVSGKLQLSFINESGLPDTINNDIDILVVEDSDNSKAYNKNSDSTNTVYYYDIGTLGCNESKDYYLTISGGSHGTITSQQKVYIDVSAVLTQVD